MMAVLIASRRSGWIIVMLILAWSRPAFISLMISMGSSFLGLSDVRISLSHMPAAVFAISGLFVLSLFPPAPITAITCSFPFLILLMAWSTLSMASGVWA